MISGDAIAESTRRAQSPRAAVFEHSRPAGPKTCAFFTPLSAERSAALEALPGLETRLGGRLFRIPVPAKLSDLENSSVGRNEEGLPFRPHAGPGNARLRARPKAARIETHGLALQSSMGTRLRRADSPFAAAARCVRAGAAVARR